VHFGSLSLGTKLSLALLAFLFVLAAATSTIIVFGFSRTQDNANERSREALEEEGKLALEALAGGLAESGALQLETAGAIGQRASRYMEEFKETGGAAPADTSGFVQTGSDIWYDPNPDRLSDVVVPNHVAALEGAVLDDITYSAPLNALLPALAENFPGQLSGEAFRPIAIIFISVNGVGRYYPPIGIQENTPAELDVSDFYDRFGPVANPRRETVWTPPYEDLNGRGLVITAQTPIYEGDLFRGIFEVDLSIDKLVDQLNQIKPTDSAFTFYVDSEGGILRTDAFDLLTGEAERSPDVAAVLDAMRDSPKDSRVEVEKVALAGRDYFLAHTPLPLLGGSIAVAAPLDEVTGQAALITESIDDEGNRTFLIMLIAMGALFLLGLAGATWLNRRLLVSPLQHLVAGTRAVAGGDLTAQVNLQRGDELGTLADSFNTMVEQLRESERVLEQRVEGRTRDLDALLRADAELFRSLDLDEVLQKLVDVAIDVMGADKSLVSIWDEQRGEAKVRAARNLSAESIEGLQDFLTRSGHTGPAHDFRPTAYQVGSSGVMPAEMKAIADREGITATMDIPIRSATRGTIGGFGVSYSEPHTFSDEEQRVLVALADRAAVAIQNAELYARAQQAASLEERQRLARELHDSVSQALYGIALGARTARTLLDQDPAKAAEPVDYVLSLAEAGLTEMRALIFELRPESLAMEGVVEALGKQIAAARARHGLDIMFESCPEPETSLEVKEAIYRIAQEALHNIVKHAKASHVDVSLQRTDAAIELVVSDDGVGFDPSGDFAGHLGLRSMRERAAKVGASLVVQSASGSGATIRFSTKPG
jgi:signal transduction histidine kinase